MSDPISVVVKVASTPDQAKMFVALLQAEGIPAAIDGGSLTDEFAISQRLMNVSSVKVMVPASSLERAKEILQPVMIDEDDLAAQAVGATGPVETAPAPRPAPSPSASKSGSSMGWIAGIATVAALVFLWAWIEASNSAHDPLYQYTSKARGTLVSLRSDGSQFGFHHDEDRDGIYELFEFWGPGKAWHEVVHPDSDGRPLRVISVEKDGLTQTWSRDRASTLYTTCTVTDAAGKVLQTLAWQPGKGFTLK